ncbi:hypothetical protein D3C86_1431710 [compost metagenome]
MQARRRSAVSVLPGWRHIAQSWDYLLRSMDNWLVCPGRRSITGNKARRVHGPRNSRVLRQCESSAHAKLRNVSPLNSTALLQAWRQGLDLRGPRTPGRSHRSTSSTSIGDLRGNDGTVRTPIGDGAIHDAPRVALPTDGCCATRKIAARVPLHGKNARVEAEGSGIGALEGREVQGEVSCAPLRCRVD